MALGLWSRGVIQHSANTFSVHGHCSAKFSWPMYSTVAVAMCWLLPISVDAIGLSVNIRQAGAENNVRLECDTVMATFYRMDSAGSMEEQLSSVTVMNYREESSVVVTFVLDGATEGLYFCRSGGDESPKKELVGE